MNYTQEQLDRAHEWVAENHSDLDSAAFDAKVREVADELAMLDAANDEADAR